MAESHVVKLNAGLEAEVLSMGRGSDHQSLTISMRISNKGKNTIYALMVGRPIVTDNTGGSFDTLGLINGIAYCEHGLYTRYCAGIPTVDENHTMPLRAFTQIDPGIDVFINIKMRAWSSKGPLISFAASLAYRLTGDLLKDATLSDAEKYKQVHMMTLSFPPISLTEEK